ncbi:hypothetical protein FRC17_005764, partial [Serendipita sp. 399]
MQCAPPYPLATIPTTSQTRRNLAHTPKILLLGSGESGKSTIIKLTANSLFQQMRILNNVPFNEYEREVYRVQVFYNLVNGMRSLMDALRDLPPLEPTSTEANDNDGSDDKRQNDVGDTDGGGVGGGGVVDGGADGGGGRISTITRRPAFQPIPPPSPSPTPPENDNGSEGGDDLRSSTSKSDPQSAQLNHTRITDLAPLSSSEYVSGSRTNHGPSIHTAPAAPTAPSRSPSVSLNLFQPGSLTPRQLTLFQELNYPPDLRPGQPFPLEFEAILRECWWGITPSQWEAIVVQAKEETKRRAGGKASRNELEKVHLGIECGILENGLGSQLDRIERESGVHLPDNLRYLYASPGRLASYFEEEYIPNDQDILRCRGRTTGIQETTDLFSEKVSKFPINTYFPDYDGDKEDVRAGMEYFRKRFLRIAVKSTRNLRTSDKKGASSSRPKGVTASSSNRSKASGSAAASDKEGKHGVSGKKSRGQLKETVDEGEGASPVKGKGKASKAEYEMRKWKETETGGTTTTSDSYGQTATAVSVSSTSRKGKEREEGERVGEMGRRAGGSSSKAQPPSMSTKGTRKAKRTGGEDERRRKDSGATIKGVEIGMGGGANRRKSNAKGIVDPGNGKRGRMVYTHFTNATDTLQLKVVILAVC